MSNFEKIIIPLIDNKIEKGDLSPEVGFIDSYTSDPDNPSGECELFLVYDDRIRTNSSIKTARKFNLLSTKRKEYTKIINGVPVYIYSFWVKPEVKKLYSVHMYLNASQKKNIIDFWGIGDDIIDKILMNNLFVKGGDHKMPLADYVPSPFIDTIIGE